LLELQECSHPDSFQNDVELSILIALN
jgi:hypothetical protein